MGKKYIWKEREKHSTPLFPYAFFPIFAHMKKWEKTQISRGNNGVGPPVTLLHLQCYSYTSTVTLLQLHSNRRNLEKH